MNDIQKEAKDNYANYELDVNINVNKINSIVPYAESRKPSSIVIKATINEHKAENLFYHLWDRFEDTWLIKCLEAEGYTLTKIEE